MTLSKFPVLLLSLLILGCQPEEKGAGPLAADRPLHLEDHIANARIEGSVVPKDLPAAVEWKFDQPQPAWKAVVPLLPTLKPARLSQEGGALRLSTGEGNLQGPVYRGGVYIDLPDWNWEDWAFVAVRMRSASPGRLTLFYNLRERLGDIGYESEPFLFRGEGARLIADGSTHTYLLRPDWTAWGTEGGWRQLALTFTSQAPNEFEILSVAVIPKEARFAEAPVGVVTDQREQIYRRALYTHAPARLEYQVRVPEGGRLDFSLSVLRADPPVTFRVTAGEGDKPRVLFQETYGRREGWGQRSVDLSSLAGQTVTLGLEADSKRPGTVGLWGAPTLSGRRTDRAPNVILYVMDAAGAEYSSAYGYHRRTTPVLERLAAEGALFENAYSNSTWSKPSTMSFMTSLQSSVLGGYKSPVDPLPDQALTMAQHLHRAGYQTGVFTSNTWCGTMSSLERGVDALRETIPGNISLSSKVVQQSFWRWRETFPGEPFWVHFQTTDVHWPWSPVPPIAGAFLSPPERQELEDMERRLGEANGATGRDWGLRAAPEQFQRAGIDRKAYFDLVRGAYDEALAHNDYQLGLLVDRLKARGEWENTILIVTADHGDWPGLGLFDAYDPEARVPYLNPYLTRVPLVVVWPGHIAPGQRFREQVSLLDLLPTVLEVTVQPQPEVLQGQSLAPLLLGRPGWKPKPVIIDEFTVDRKTNQLNGVIEMIDGRWGASLAIGGEEAEPRLLLYDLWEDRYTQRSVHAERPKLAKEYQQRLERQFREHVALAKRFTQSKEGALSSEQLEVLKSLGYIQ